MRGPAVGPYGDAFRALRAFCSDSHRDHSKLDSALAALLKKSQSDLFTPSQKEEARRCAETIELFRRSLNEFGATTAPYLDAPRFEPLNVQGAMLSVQPELLAGSAFPPKGERIGLVFMRPQKRPDPDECKTEKTRAERQEFRREVARYMLVMGWMLLKANGVKEELIDLKKMFVWDLRMRESISFPSDRAVRLRRINSACKQVFRLWSTIEPKPGDMAK